MVKNVLRDGTSIEVSCPVCLGLGDYETNDAYRPPFDPKHFVVLHSSLDVEDAIALLPEGKLNDRRQEG